MVYGAFNDTDYLFTRNGEAMSDEQTPSVDEIKERLKVEIPVEDEPMKDDNAVNNVAEELKGLGRQFAETLQKAWESEERQRVEGEIRTGLRSFADEVDKVIREARESQAASKVKGEAVEIKARVETSDIGKKARVGMVQGLQWISEELGKLADKFNPPADEAASTEKSPEDIDDGPESA